MIRSGRTENYSAPREFSFEVKAIFPNGMGLHVVARQFNYRDPWEAKGRVNDQVDAMLTRNGALTPLPKGYSYFQGIDEECQLDEEQLREVVACIAAVNPKLYLLQEMTGDL
jgi:DNA-directed RNA polymerase specialized sigma54-like protein